MAKENRSQYAVLGLLTWGPMSGYTLKKASEQSIGNFWNESYGQIYPMLKHLAAEGLATASAEKQAGKPDRYVYALTDKGRKALQRWLRKPAEQEVGRIEILLKLFFGRHIPLAANVRQLQRFQTRQRQLLQKFAAMEERLRAEHAGNPDLPYWLMTISYGRHVCQARLHWSDEALTMLRGLSGNTSAAQSPDKRAGHPRVDNKTRRRTSSEASRHAHHR
jgi:PadR family transcriptional regulator, regulatory protein AphA